MRPPIPEDTYQTYKTMLIGLIIAMLMVAPSASVYFNTNWTWAYTFPVSWLGIVLGFMTTFFHELGHTAAGWFYGYVSVPSFDLSYGGGMTWYVTGQLFILNLAVDAALIYFIYQLREWRSWQMACIGLLLFHLATAYVDAHQAMLSMAGPFAETVIGGFMLARAWLNRAPRGIAERLFNAMFGFGMTMHAILSGWSLIHDPDVRQGYDEQKGGHGFGDFNQAADHIGISFNEIIWFYLLTAVLAVIIPIILYTMRDRLYLARYGD